MKKLVEFSLRSPLMSGGIRIADNFFESEPVLRGSVLRAAFANEILMECPFAEVPNPDGKYYFVERKDRYHEPAKGVCENCPQREICEKFSDMYFGFAFPQNAVPAPFTAKTCKFGGTAHGIQDTIIQRRKIACAHPDCGQRMESLKGLLTSDDNGSYQKCRIPMTLSTHTAINHRTHTALDSTLYSVRAVKEGISFFAEIDDCGTDLLRVGNTLYAGKYTSVGFGKLEIRTVTEVPECSAEQIQQAQKKFQSLCAKEDQYAAVLLLSDALPDIPQQNQMISNQEYLRIWQTALFGKEQTCLTLEQIYTETQLYSGYDTAKPWGEWKSSTASLLMLKGTSLLLKITKGQEAAAYALLAELSNTGIGSQTNNGFGKIAVCHELHCKGIAI